MLSTITSVFLCRPFILTKIAKQIQAKKIMNKKMKSTFKMPIFFGSLSGKKFSSSFNFGVAIFFCFRDELLGDMLMINLQTDWEIVTK